MVVCCDHHDYCYGIDTTPLCSEINTSIAFTFTLPISCSDTCGTLRDKCDQDFSACLNKVCERDQGNDIENCQGTADLLGGGVGAFGCGAFKSSQENACVCREVIGSDGGYDDIPSKGSSSKATTGRADVEKANKKKKNLPKKRGAIPGYVWYDYHLSLFGTFNRF